MIRGIQCEGCHRFIMARHLSKHCQDCAPLLRLRMEELQNQSTLQLTEYRKIKDVNERLRFRVRDLMEHVDAMNSLVFGIHPPPHPLESHPHHHH